MTAQREVALGRLFRREKVLGYVDAQMLSVYRDHGVVVKNEEINPNKTAEDRSIYQLVEPGWLVVNRMKAWQGAVAISDLRGIVSRHYICFRPTHGENDRYLHYLLRSPVFTSHFASISRGVRPGQIEIDNDELALTRLPLPPSEKQRRIADFLDDQITRIDNIIAARRLQLRAIDEEDLASMADALSGDCREQGGAETGWGWLPRVPATWGIAPVFAFYDAQLGKMLNPERAAGAYPRPYLRNANVHWFDIDVSDVAMMSFEPGERVRYQVLPGDLLVCEGGAGVAEAAVWRGEIAECYFQKSLHRIRARAHLPAEWLMYWLRLAKASGVFESDGNLATIPHLTGEQLREYKIPIPPPGEVPLAALQASLDANARLRFLVRVSVDRLDELKRSLITAAVTGEFEVATAGRSRVLR